MEDSVKEMLWKATIGSNILYSILGFLMVFFY
jgi:hypothetical protein